MVERPSEGPSATSESFHALVTIGVPLGIINDPETQAKKGLLRHGRELLRVDIDDYMVLLRGARTAARDHLAAWASENHVEDPHPAIDRCIEDGLLRDIDFNPEIYDHWNGLRLETVGIGMGPDAGNNWTIELPRQEVARIDRITYLLWAASDGRSVGDVTEMLAKEGVGTRDSLMVVLPVCVFRLLSRGAAFLDRIP